MLSTDQERIGKFIAENRKKVKLTQDELAIKLGVTNKSVSNWDAKAYLITKQQFKEVQNQEGKL